MGSKKHCLAVCKSCVCVLTSLQSFQSLCVPFGSGDFPRFMISPQFSIDELRQAVSGMTEQVEKLYKRQLVKSGGRVSDVKDFVSKIS